MAIRVDGAVVDMDLIGGDLIGRLLEVPRRAAALARAGAHGDLPDPALLGRRMAVLYTSWQNGGLPDLPDLAGVLLRCAHIPTDGALGRTCLAAARAVADWGGLAYHSAAHHAEVATNAMVLAALAGRLGQPVDRHATSVLLAASLAHDIHYLPSVARERFAAEAASADALDAIAAASGCDAADRQAMRALVIATEPGIRLRQGGPLGAPLDTTAERLLHGAPVDAGLVRLAAILSDADLLSSVGLTASWYRVQQARLEAEAGRHHEPGETARFFTAIVGDSFISAPGRIFADNLTAIRRTICRRG